MVPGGPTSDSSWAGLGVAVSACVVAGAAAKMSATMGDALTSPGQDTESPQPPPSPLAGGRRPPTSPGSLAHQDRGQGGAPSDREDGAGQADTTEQAAYTGEQSPSNSGTMTEPEGSEDEGGSGTRLLATAPTSSPANSLTTSLATSLTTASPATSPGILERSPSPSRTRRPRAKRGGPPTSV